MAKSSPTDSALGDPGIILLILVAGIAGLFLVCNIFQRIVAKCSGHNQRQHQTDINVNNYITTHDICPPTFKLSGLETWACYLTTHIDPNSVVCIICLDDFSEHDIILKLDCNHVFHGDCLHKWFERCYMKYEYPFCPICRLRYISNPSKPPNSIVSSTCTNIVEHVESSVEIDR